jgi:protease I
LIILHKTHYRHQFFFSPKNIIEDDAAKFGGATTAVRACHGMKDGTVMPDLAIGDARADEYDALVICGGSSVPEFLWNDKKLQELASAMAAAGKVVAAICLSTIVLAKAKLLTDRDATVYFLPQAIQELKAAGARYVSQGLIVHDKLILAEGPAESQKFGQAIRTALS